MTTLEYHRPETIVAALELLEADGAEVLAGGTVLNARREPPQIVIDVQALGLDRRSKDNGAATFGAMVRLQDLIDDPDTPPLISEAAYREGPNTLRNAATLGGVVAGADWESELLASLLVHETVVMVEHRDRREELSLSQLLAEKDRLGRGIITSLRVASGGIGSAARTGRTPADTPIVAPLP